MKPLKLIIEGLYSYQSRQIIDFTKLTDAHLFGIFGSVGSGKSSILEAITYALYGTTDKLNSRDNRAYNMMNLKSDSLYIEFDFKVEEIIYKVSVKAKRNSKKFSDVKKIDRLFYKIVNDEIIPIEEKDIHDAIGLSYDNFKRTIIIPQGQFKEFLELGDTDRTKMLKELFNLGKYDLYEKLRPLINKNLSELDNLKGQFEALGDVNIEQIDEFDKHLITIKEELESVSNSLIANQKLSDEYKKIKNLKIKEVEAERKVSLLKAKDEEFRLLEEDLKQYEYCLMNFKQLIIECDRLRKSILDTKEALLNSKNLLETDNLILEEKQKDFYIIKQVYDSREGIKKEIEELGKIVNILSLQEDINVELKEQNLINKELLVQTKLSNEVKLACELLNKSLDKEKELLPDMLLINKLKDWYNNEYSIKKEINNKDVAIVELIKEIAALNSDCCVFRLNGSEEKSPTAIYNNLLEKKEELRLSVKPIEEELDSLGVHKKFEEYASLLVEGKACPLCGSEHHPSIMDSKEVGSLIEKYKSKKNLIENSIKEIDASVISLQKITSKIEAKEEQKKSLLTEQKVKIAEFELFSKTFVWDKYKSVEELKTAIDLYADKQKCIKDLEISLKENITRKEQIENNVNKKEKSLSVLENLIKEKESICKILMSQLISLKLEDYSGKSKEGINNQCSLLQDKLNKIETDYSKLSLEIEALLAKQNKLKGLISASELILVRDNDAELIKLGEINVNIEKSPYEDIEKIRLILSKEIDIQFERARLDSYKKDLNTFLADLSNLKNEINDKVYDEQKDKEIIELLNNLSSKKDLLNSKIGEIQSTIGKIKKDLEKLRELKKRESELKLRATDLDVLRKLFTASGFVNYVSSVHLRNLCAAANERFHKLTSQRLSIEMTDNNNFQVRDYMNGGNVRSVKTLSGGQSFQASLALALALTDSIQKFTQSNQNFFFLDEGFGSLDKEALLIVFDALKSLKKENRIVGLISHVEELQQEMGVFVKVVNDKERGSELSFSWE